MGNVSDVATVTVCACAVIVTGILVHREWIAGNSDDAVAVSAVDWQQLSEEGHLLGSSDAPIKIVEFTDFTCRYCAEAASVLEVVREKYGERLAMVIHPFPLDGDAAGAAYQAAVAAECAAVQGRFAAYHDALFLRPSLVEDRDWQALAREAGVTALASFEQCLSSRSTIDKVAGHRAMAVRLGMRSTPTFVHQGVTIRGVQRLEYFDSLVAYADPEWAVGGSQ